VYPARLDPARIRLADVAPPACSSCYGAKPTERHVDFGAAYDGPVVPLGDSDNVVGLVGHSIDDLLICEECLSAAAALLGLRAQAGLEAQIEQLEAGNSHLATELAITKRELEATRALAAIRTEQDPRRPGKRPARA
jgi:hypothetical protein